MRNLDLACFRAIMPRFRGSAEVGLVFEYARQIGKRHELLKHLVLTNLKAGHRNKVLGNIWFLLDPFLQMVLYYLIFGVFFKLADNDPVEYLLYLISGLLCISYFTGTVSFCTDSIRRNSGLILSNYFPLGLIPLSILLFRFYDLLFGLAVLFAVMLFTDFVPSWHLVWLPLLLLVYSLLTLGIAFIVSIIGVFFADLGNILSFALRFVLYLSPVLYTIERIPERYRDIYMLNPFAVFLELIRGVILYEQHPDLEKLAYFSIIALVSFVIGFWAMSRKESILAKYI